MTCPKCCFEFESWRAACPECGVRLVKSVSGMMKTSAVMIAAGEAPEFFGSVQDVPEPLRAQLLEITTGSNSGTIVIADQAGKEQITQVMVRRETARSRKDQPELVPSAVPGWLYPTQIAWAGAVLVIGTGAIALALLMLR